MAHLGGTTIEECIDTAYKVISERTGKHKDLAGYLNDVQEELMDAILYIQAAKEELYDNSNSNTVNEAIAEANKASFRPPHPSNAAQLDWDDHAAPV